MTAVRVWRCRRKNGACESSAQEIAETSPSFGLLPPLPWVIAIISELNKSDGFAHTGDADMAAWAESAAMWAVLNATERLAPTGHGLMSRVSPASGTFKQPAALYLRISFWKWLRECTANATGRGALIRQEQSSTANISCQLIAILEVRECSNTTWGF
ncbi:hypothetical protein AB9E29_01495 [Rhizobium leguminosarum]|uniref:hypothetical protein n=1 Tax=Rhizobium leguminosarum TaxID=384 RepID=UPI001C98D794|nr:hypothetical protein [Rhizobium leguminosarum]MBY5328309.1 hypothetical protein [Rhizobium leguminosarum]